MRQHILDSHISSCQPAFRLTRPLSHQNSNVLSLHPFWRSLGSPNQIPQISGLFTIWTLGKILERLALALLLPHLSISPSFSPLQLAYRKFHSTETALLKLTNDIMDSIDLGKVTILSALDVVCFLRHHIFTFELCATFRTPLLELLHKSLGTATSRQFFPACTGFLYAIESIS